MITTDTDLLVRDIDSAARALTAAIKVGASQWRTWAAQNVGRTAAIYRRAAQLTKAS
jgi:hypothetical protein